MVLLYGSRAADVLPYVEADLKKIAARVIEKAKGIYLSKSVSRLQEQLQAERDLRVALEVGLSMSSRQISSSRGLSLRRLLLLKQMWPLKQKVAELQHQLNQQRQHHYGSLSDACDRYQQFQNHNSQQKYFQQDFDRTLAFANHERKQRTEESLLGAKLRNIKGQVLTSGSNSRQPARKQFLDSASFSDSKSTEASTSISMDELCAVDSASVPSTSRATEAYVCLGLVPVGHGRSCLDLGCDTPARQVQ
ncbi:hypothetical protein HYC85_004720 [Camellia sinensis]|uniref:Uncharacterized protein n=1 Tax=Camellia sinensis TaxID=4442 RepID=A0A7J7HYC7_CAMSI|nr:hypothetical protein HYC85_004720 [Camellia sinensis]